LIAAIETRHPPNHKVGRADSEKRLKKVRKRAFFGLKYEKKKGCSRKKITDLAEAETVEKEGFKSRDRH